MIHLSIYKKVDVIKFRTEIWVDLSKAKIQPLMLDVRAMHALAQV